MSNTATFALGAGSGLALWYLAKPKTTKTTLPASNASPSPEAIGSSSRPAPRNCVVQVDAVGLFVDGARVTLDDAIRCCQAAGSASVSVAKNASASTCLALANALTEANVPTVRNATARNADTYTKFTLRYYPEGRKGNAKQRWFLAEASIPWAEARDRLIKAGVVDPEVSGRTFEPGGWMLSVDRSQFHAPLAEPLPVAPRNSAETSATFTLAIYPEGQWGATKRVRWFRADPPTTWKDARDRLVAAGVIDGRVTQMGPNSSGAWILTTEPRQFDHDKAEPLPDPVRRRQSRNAPIRYTTDGRRIVRDGAPMVLVERVDLGDDTYALSPAHTDQLVQRIAYLLNRYGMR